MYTMDNVPSQQHHEGAISPSLPHIFSVKSEAGTDFWNPPLIHPVNGVITENFSTYTPLETVYPENSYAPSNAQQYFTYTTSSSSPSIQPMYTSPFPNLQLNSEYPEFQPSYYRDPDLGLTARDEGLGSSPSSFNSSSPPLIQPAASQEPVPSTSSSSNYDYANHTSARSSPENLAYSDLPASECGNCGSRSDVVWVNTHFLCRTCYLDRTRAALHSQEQSPNERKRKRSPTVNKKNLVCTNCDAVDTSLWRRSFHGASVCNACGLYEKLHKVPRPKTMRKDKIQKRNRKPKAAAAKPKRKNSASRSMAMNAIKVEEYDPSDPQQFSLPTYNTIHMRGMPTNQNNFRDLGSGMQLPPISNSPPFYANYRPDMYMYTVPPNEIINLQHNLPPSPHGLTPSPHAMAHSPLDIPPSPLDIPPSPLGVSHSPLGIAPSPHASSA